MCPPGYFSVGDQTGTRAWPQTPVASATRSRKSQKIIELDTARTQAQNEVQVSHRILTQALIGGDRRCVAAVVLGFTKKYWFSRTAAQNSAVPGLGATHFCCVGQVFVVSRACITGQ